MLYYLQNKIEQQIRESPRRPERVNDWKKHLRNQVSSAKAEKCSKFLIKIKIAGNPHHWEETMN